MPRLDEHAVPAAPILRREDLLEHPQVKTNALLETREHPTLGTVRQPRPAARFERTPSAIRELAPALGEHNDDVLEELGYGAEQRSKLAASGVLRGAAVKDG